MFSKLKWLILLLAILAVVGLVWWSKKGVGETQNNIDLKVPASSTGNRSQDTQPVSALAIPSRISIPKIGVDASIEPVELDAVGRMDVPKDFNNVGWYELGYKPGELGGAVFSGHLDTISGKRAVFFNLNKIAVGDEIKVTLKDGKLLKFIVSEKEQVKVGEFPMKKVFESTGSSTLALITCAGTFDRSVRNYTERLIVYSRLKTI